MDDSTKSALDDKKNILSHNKKFGGREIPKMVNVAQWHHSAPRFFSHLSSAILGMSLLTQEEPQGLKKAAAAQHITSSYSKVQNPEGERGHISSIGPFIRVM